jgi:hypothetical protein
MDGNLEEGLITGVVHSGDKRKVGIISANFYKKFEMAPLGYWGARE